MTPDCVLTVETHGVKLSRREKISVMFRRLWDNHQWVKHDQFNWVEGASDDNIAVRFRVTNKLNNGEIVNKSNYIKIIIFFYLNHIYINAYFIFVERWLKKNILYLH